MLNWNIRAWFSVFCILVIPTLIAAQGAGEPFAYLYEEYSTTNGETRVRRARYTASEKMQKDQERINEIMQNIGEYVPQSQQQYVDPRAVAEWQYYWEQLKLWETYVKKQVLNDEPLDKSVQDLDFNLPTTLDEQMQQISQSYEQQARQASIDMFTKYINLLGRIEERIWQREVYRAWIERNKMKLNEFAYEWLRRMTGEELEIEGRVYLVSPKPLKNIPAGKVNIVTTNLTPYDLLNEDGSLKSQNR